MSDSSASTPFPQPQQATPTTPHKPILLPPTYHHISLISFYYPKSLDELAPREEASFFQTRIHRRRYLTLRATVQSAVKSAIAQQARERKDAPPLWDQQLHNAAVAFHAELSRRIGWNHDTVESYRQHQQQTIKPSLERPESIRSQKPDSCFPSINLFLQNYPRYSVASTVQDFYQRQEERLKEYQALQQLKHRWEIWELYYIFHRAVVQLRRAFSSTNDAAQLAGISWYQLLTTKKSRLAVEYAPEFEEPVSEQEMALGTPAGDTARRQHQFEALQAVRKYLASQGIGFPYRFCPGGLSLMEFFEPGYTFPQPPKTDEDARKIFANIQQNEKEKARWERPGWQKLVAEETERLLDCERPEDYYRFLRKETTGKQNWGTGQGNGASTAPVKTSELLQTAESVNMVNTPLMIEFPIFETI